MNSTNKVHLSEEYPTWSLVDTEMGGIIYPNKDCWADIIRYLAENTRYNLFKKACSEEYLSVVIVYTWDVHIVPQR